MNINHLSVSRAQVWNQCQAKYKFQYHLNIPSEEEEPFYFIYGKIIHKIAEEYVRLEGERLISEITSDVLAGKIEVDKGKEVPRLPEEYKRKIPDHLKSIKILTDQIGYGGKLEWPFRFDLDPPHNRHIVGFIDRLISRDGKCWILDYKTTKKGKFRKTRKTVVDDLQLKCYARIAQREFGIKAEDIKAALYYLEGAELIGASFSQASLDNTERELLETYKLIESMHPDNVIGNVGQHCNRCEYRKICPFYSLT